MASNDNPPVEPYVLLEPEVHVLLERIAAALEGILDAKRHALAERRRVGRGVKKKRNPKDGPE